MEMREQIFIKLLNEGVDTWRPTYGEKINDNVFRVLPTADYDPDDEEWEFIPGTIVKCDLQKRDSGRGERIYVWVAVEMKNN